MVLRKIQIRRYDRTEFEACDKTEEAVGEAVGEADE